MTIDEALAKLRKIFCEELDIPDALDGMISLWDPHCVHGVRITEIFAKPFYWYWTEKPDLFLYCERYLIDCLEGSEEGDLEAWIRAWLKKAQQ